MKRLSVIKIGDIERTSRLQIGINENSILLGHGAKIDFFLESLGHLRLHLVGNPVLNVSCRCQKGIGRQITFLQ